MTEQATRGGDQLPARADFGKSLPPQDVATGNAENSPHSPALPKWKKAMEGFFHGQTGPVAVPRVTVAFNAERAEYAPGELLQARYRLEAVDPSTLTAIERSVVWYTEGKGEEDFGVVFFDRLHADSPGGGTDASADSAVCDWLSGRFGTRLPPSPLSYEGLIVKIRWCVRVRLFFASGRDFVSEHVFFVGDIPVARPLERAVS